MSKFSDFFLHFKKRYDDEQRRLARMDRFLDKAEETENKVHAMTYTVENLGSKINEIDKKVDKLQDHVDHMEGRLGIIGEGTKMELFDTLYHWKKILVDERGWASPAEKKEVTEIYEIYHDGLKGNGQGEVYYKEIIKLPETPTTNQ